MRNFLVATIVLALMFLLLPSQGSAWDTKNGHTMSTDAAVGATQNLVKFVNEFELGGKEFRTDDPYDKEDSPWNEKYDRFMYTGWLRKGSIFEDYGPDHEHAMPQADDPLHAVEYLRFFNHYYDPIADKGLYDRPLKYIHGMCSPNNAFSFAANNDKIIK